MIDPLIETSELAERLGLPERTLTMWRYRDRGPAFVRVGKSIRYRQSDIDTWIDENRHQPSGSR